MGTKWLVGLCLFCSFLHSVRPWFNNNSDDEDSEALLTNAIEDEDGSTKASESPLISETATATTSSDFLSVNDSAGPSSAKQTRGTEITPTPFKPLAKNRDSIKRSDAAVHENLQSDAAALQERFSTCTDCMVRLESYSKCPLHLEALNLRTWAHELSNVLTNGCPLGCCDTGRCCVTSDPLLSDVIRDTTRLLQEAYRVLQDSCTKCPRDGKWSEWAAWSSCPVTCGSGTLTRMRTCNDPPPSNGGRNCQARNRETSRCYPGPCCVPVVDGWTPWEAWSYCSVSCGSGTRQRIRTCRNLPPNACEHKCTGQDLETDDCRAGSCCEQFKGVWGSWEPWSSCSVTCGVGDRTRRRTCNNPPNMPRECDTTCTGSDVEQTGCDAGNCCVDGVWGSWNPWSSCSATCGSDGVTSRSRACDSPPPNWCGKICPGSESESTKCNCQPCGCEEGSWSTWSSWGTCPVTCGTATLERRRVCRPALSNSCQPPCPTGSAIDTDQRRCGPDPEHGNWCSWSSWSICSSTCGPGWESRSRRCDCPVQNACGLPCPGPNQDRRQCDIGACPSCFWNAWTQWSNCPTSCGLTDGFRVRTRQCIYPDGRLCEEGCVGSDREQMNCPPLRPCAPPAEWSSWEPWCPCNCRRGVTTRLRRCQHEGVDVDHIQCAGDAKEERYCDVRQNICPECITACAGKSDGTYPSCTGCSDYISCRVERATIRQCPADREWDGHRKQCVEPPSESCALQKGVSTCQMGADGQYHLPGDCTRYVECINGLKTDHTCYQGVEFNAHLKRCDWSKSPTCIRSQDPSPWANQKDSPNIHPDKIGDEDDDGNNEKESKKEAENNTKPLQEEVTSSYKDQLAKDANKTTGNKRFVPQKYLSRPQNHAKVNTTSAKMNHSKTKHIRAKTVRPDSIHSFEEKLEVKFLKGVSDDRKDDSVKVACHTNCQGLKKGKRYQSCQGCRFFLHCPFQAPEHLRKCHNNREWDDNVKRCMKHSLTCRIKN